MRRMSVPQWWHAYYSGRCPAAPGEVRAFLWAVDLCTQAQEFQQETGTGKAEHRIEVG